MKIIYTPDDGPTQEFGFRADALSQREAEAIEDVGGATWETYDEFGEKFMKDNRKAYRALLWIMLRRTNPKLKFADLEDIKVSQIRATFDDEETATIRQSIAADEDLSDDERANLLMRLGDVPALEDVPLEPEGKDEGSDIAIAS